jgi:N-formylglutamate deformylase
MSNTAYSLFEPTQRTSSVVFASPHSGRAYPTALVARSALDMLTLRSSEDAFVDQLFSCVTDFGAPLLTANAPRAFVDLNRSPDELDPALIEGVRRSAHNPRIASGLGVIPRVVANGRTIYSGKLPRAEADKRLAQVWHPYHRALQTLLDQAHRGFGQAILIDCHSMPHEAVDGVARNAGPRPDIILGDRFGAAAHGDIVERIESAFASAGLVVTRNAPFAGAYIAQAYGRPSRNQHAIQIEIDRALYMDEKRIEPNANFEALKTILRDVAAEIVEIGEPEIPLAAE